MSEKTKVIEFDEIFDYIGHFDMFQIMLFFIIGFSTYQVAVQNISGTFLNAEMKHWCEIPRLSNYRWVQTHTLSLKTFCIAFYMQLIVIIILYGHFS